MHLHHTLHCWHVWCYILRIHNTYLQSKCFLSQLYNDTSCFVQRQSTLLCLATHRFTRGVPLLKAVHYAQTDITFVAEVQPAPCLFFSANTRNTASVFLWKASAVNVWCQIVYVSLEYTAEKSPFLYTTRWFHPQQGVQLDCTFHKICCWECQKSFLFSKVFRSLGHHGSEGCHCLQNGGIIECGKSGRAPSHLNKMEYSTPL